jgi:signal transduction histidine kinase
MKPLKNIPKFFYHLTNVPTTDPDDARRGKLLNILLAGLIVLGILTLAAVGIYAITGLVNNQLDKNGTIFIVQADLIFLVGTLGIYYINRFRSVSIASSILLVFCTIILAFSDNPNEVTNGRSLFFFALPIIMASVLLRSYASFIFAGVCGIAISLVGWSQSQYPNLMGIIGFFAIAFVAWLSSRSMEQALRDLRIINLNLDNIVTERTRDLAESLTREHIEAERNQAILNSIADGVVVFNANNVVLLVNPALSHLTETPIQDLTGIRLDEFVQTRKLSPANRGMIMGLVEHPDRIAAGVRVEWGKKTLSVSIARVQDIITNENIGTVAVFRDVTREAELEKMKETFVAIISHELRTPLNAILGHVEMLTEPIFGPLNEQQSGIVERVMVNARRLLVMVNDLLDEAQMKAGKLSILKQPFKTSTLMENLHNTLDKISTDKGLSITTEIDPNMPETIEGDHQRLQQILINLVSNSIKFTEKGGINIRILRIDKDHWTIEVTDTGSGIPEKEIPHIFETFRQIESTTTRRFGGFGLGLTIVKQLVELMDGEIIVKSELDKGSTFTVTLPL